MSLIELFVIAVGLSMDACAVSICKGLSMKKMSWKNAIIAGIYFGGFQGLMPAIGYLLGVNFADIIERFDHWVAFILLAIIGVNMIKEAFGEEEELDSKFDAKTMIPLAIATSIDALAVGVSFAFLKVSIIYSVIFIAITTFVISFLGIRIGNIFGTRYKSKAEIAGGIILVFMGCKILVEHLGII
ncbi:MAG: manganese efflux pump [Lachnospiraceae bacterium]|nr:manganese efflux pump [Lachnospiraceae bacterium]